MKLEDIKIEVVDYINNNIDHFPQKSLFRRELKQMKAKYIYKDISVPELKKDIEYLKNVNRFIYGQQLKKRMDSENN